MTFSVQSTSFANGERIPQKYSRSADNVSPPVEWHDAPRSTKSFVLVLEDPDAPRGMFRHWAAYDIDARANGLPEGAGSASRPRFKMAVNDFGNKQYDGPQPPPGHGTHHYHFRCAALDVDHLKVPANASVTDVWDAARAHALAQAEIIGTFEG